MNSWLIKRALPALEARTATTYVLCRGQRVVGYYALSTAGVDHGETSSKLRQNLPNPIPAFVLARLAVHVDEHGRGIGRSLLQHAGQMVLSAAEIAAARLLIVHPLDDDAAKFYGRLGYKPLKADSKTMYISLEQLADAVAGS